MQLIADNKPADVVTVAEALGSINKLDYVGGMSYLAALVENVPTAANIRRYAEIVHERAILRRLAAAGGEIAESAFQPLGRSVREILDQAELDELTAAGTGAAGVAGTFTVTTTGTPTPALSESGSLPSGVSFTDNHDGTATLAGTPAAGSGGTYNFTITATGSGTPATQSFTLTVDEAALKRQIDYIVDDCRATMVVAAGVETQEYTYLSLEERKALIRRTIDGVGGRVPVMVGVSHPSFKTAIALAHEAERLGAAAVQLLAPLRPFAGPPTQADLIAYFEAIGRETKLPITLYLNPGPGADVSIPDTIALAKLPNVQLIKESSRDLARVSRLIVEIDRAGHARYFTTMQMLLATLQLGGSGATMPPPGCEIARHVIDAFLAKDYERAAAIQLQFALFPAKWMHRGLAPAMKAAMNLIGIPAGEPYPPYAPLSRDEMTALAATLRGTVLAPRFKVTAAA